MDTLKEMLKHADDDYLTGLCNKGTVKRAYKDLGQETPAVKWQETEAEVALKEETCVIRMPLGESTCSCPSRSICRHIVTAILWLKQEQAEAAAPEKEEAAAEDTEGSAQKEEKAAAEQNNTEKTPRSMPAGEKEQAKPHLLEEILQIPPDRLKRACRGRKFEQFLAHMNAGELPPIEESSIITVTLPWEKATVKLLEPFAYSSCTCHSRELCAHKAQAVLAYQILKGRLSLKELSGLREEESLWDEEQVRRAGKSVLESVLHQMYTGLSRQSPESLPVWSAWQSSPTGQGCLHWRAGFGRPLRNIRSILQGRLPFEAGRFWAYFSGSGSVPGNFRRQKIRRRSAGLQEAFGILTSLQGNCIFWGWAAGHFPAGPDMKERSIIFWSRRRKNGIHGQTPALFSMRESEGGRLLLLRMRLPRGD